MAAVPIIGSRDEPQTNPSNGWKVNANLEALITIRIGGPHGAGPAVQGSEGVTQPNVPPERAEELGPDPCKKATMACATFALKDGEWVRRARLVIVSPDSLAQSCPLSGRVPPIELSEIVDPLALALFGSHVEPQR
jgi:hypothetical protein